MLLGTAGLSCGWADEHKQAMRLTGLVRCRLAHVRLLDITTHHGQHQCSVRPHWTLHSRPNTSPGQVRSQSVASSVALLLMSVQEVLDRASTY